MTLIKGIATGATMLIVLSAPSAQAGYVLHLTEQGSNVVATGKGPIDLTGLSPVGLFFLLPALEPSAGIIQTGLSNLADVYLGVTGPANFGSGGITGASSGSGDVVGIPAPLFFLCQTVTYPTIPCRTPRPGTTRPSTASA
jgi:hypothetical protein